MLLVNIVDHVALFLRITYFVNARPRYIIGKLYLTAVLGTCLQAAAANNLLLNIAVLGHYMLLLKVEKLYNNN